MNLDEFLERLANELGDVDPDKLTSEQLINATVKAFRLSLYSHYPAAEPKVIEVLLLLFVNYMKELPEDEEYIKDENVEAIQKEATRFAYAMRKTLKTIHQT